ncbi:MAG: NUDIX hydrolase [Planctomycetes bacterium]|nr:NUDIX hydrolase [Planctomycetota bacterium]
MIRTGRKQLHQGRLFTMAEYTFEKDDGSTYTHDIIEHPGAAVVIPMLSKDEVILVEQYRSGANRRLLELPAGLLEKGEDPRECAKRELREETGYEAAKLELLFSIYPSAGFLTEKMHIFLAQDLSHVGEQQLDDDEDVEVVVMNFRDLRIQLRAGNIQDGKTVAGLGYLMTFKPFLGKEAD